MHSDQKLIFNCSVDSATIFILLDGNVFLYGYDCNQTLTDETTRSYKIECSPYYETSTSTFNVPKRREDATIECRAPKYEDGYDIFEASITWAVPCNNIKECYDGEDENNCEFPFWTIPTILFGTGLVLCFSFAAYLHKYSRQEWNGMK